jgi:putative hydrolase of the HAD superfamily
MMPVFPPVVLLDLDDTILQDSVLADACWRQVCARFAAQLGMDAETLMATIKRQSAWYWSDPDRHRRGRLNMVQTRREIVRAALAGFPTRLLDRLADAYTRLREARMQPFPGAIETVTTLRQRGIRLGLLTNGAADMQQRKIARFCLEPLFEVVLIEGALGYGKPDPRVFQVALERLGAAPSQAWMIGNDLDMDIAPAAALGLGTVWIDHTRQGTPAASDIRPARTVHTLAEVLEDGCV